jgi:hypothetical protein
MKTMKRFFIGLGVLFLLPVISISLLIIYWDLRTPPSFETDPMIALENWVAVPAGEEPRIQHNANTDLVYFKDAFFLIHAQSKWHLEDKNGALLVKRSTDARTWEPVAEITVPDTDVRDPKFAVIGGKLFLYFLPNWHFDPLPETTYYTVSDDGVTWKKPRELDTITAVHRFPDGTSRSVTGGGWNLWRPKSRDGKTWYVMASGRKPLVDIPTEYGGYIEGDAVKTGDTTPLTVLFSSTDGVNWKEVSEVYTVHGTFESCLEFLPDGGMIATMRCSSLGTGGYAFGNPTANTVIATAPYPFTDWSYAHSFITRLDGATLIPLAGRIFAVGRNHLGPRFDMGNHLATKRTAFFEVERDRLIFLFDLASNGDTSYTGVVKRGDDIYVSYYTCPVEKDYPWVLGVCFFPKTEIRMVKLSAEGLVRYADMVRFK